MPEKMTWEEVVADLAKFIDLMTSSLDTGCMACPAVMDCNRRDCRKHIVEWAQERMVGE